MESRERERKESERKERERESRGRGGRREVVSDSLYSLYAPQGTV